MKSLYFQLDNTFHISVENGLDFYSSFTEQLIFREASLSAKFRNEII